ncbi:actin binding LIM protein Uncoordinated 115a isoform X4 [Rhodnius prolixus]|uniref:actin binding LIM protein Uncoordinated 115a isoform X4 n=1 Tax=Rhodnius prolixus TaxID=13249 RepID=UPI003D1897F3
MEEGNDSEDGKTYCQCCKKKCSGEVLKVQDKYFHIACFKCIVCKNSLAQGGFFCKDGSYYCTEDYQKKFGTKCAECKKYVEGDVVTALGNTYHQACFTCANCKQAFPSGERVTYTGKIVLCSKCSNLPDENNTQSHSVTGNWQKLICLDHSTVLIFFDFFFCKFLFYLECSRCFQELKEGQAVIALDRQWHVWCFKCTDCGVPLHGEFMGKDGEPYCEKDYHKHFGVKCAYCSRYISGKVLQAGDNHHFHPTCARCAKCGDPFGNGEEMYLQGSAIWHPRCGPGPQSEQPLANGHSHSEIDRISNSDIPLSIHSHGTSLNGSLYGIDKKRAGSPGLLLREYKRDYPDISRIYTYSYLTEMPSQGYLKKPIDPYDKPPTSPHFHRPQHISGSGGLRGSGKWSRTGAMSGLVESLARDRPKSPHMNNEEPIELAHFPDAHPPKPDDKPKIERDDFPAPPYPYTDPERRRRWSDSYKGVPDSDEEDTVDATVTKTKVSTVDSKLKKEEAELSKLSSGMGKVFLASVKERERIMRQRQLDPRNASRSPSASSQPSLRLRYQSPINASPSRNLDAPRPWDDEDTLDRCSSYRSSVGRSIPTIPTYNVVSSLRQVPKPGYGLAPRSHTFSSTTGDFSYSLGDKAPSTDFSSAKSDVSGGSISEVDRATMSVGGVSYLRRSLPNMCGIQVPAKVYPYHLLVTTNYRLPPDVDRCNLERHLSQAEFETLFQCTRSEFYMMPTWKRNDLKKRARLF